MNQQPTTMYQQTPINQLLPGQNRPDYPVGYPPIQSRRNCSSSSLGVRVKERHSSLEIFRSNEPKDPKVNTLLRNYYVIISQFRCWMH